MDKRTIKDLTIRVYFMFAAVMQNADNFRQFLQMTLGFPIEKVVEKNGFLFYMIYLPGVFNKSSFYILNTNKLLFYDTL